MYMDSANTSVTSTTEDQRPSSRLTRSRSLETSKGRATLRSRSLDCAGDRSSPEADEDEEAVSGQRFVVLADYMALTSREIDLNEDEVVELIKVGCAGWWYVRITTYPYPEGWAPSTYLEKMTTWKKQILIAWIFDIIVEYQFIRKQKLWKRINHDSSLNSNVSILLNRECQHVQGH